MYRVTSVETKILVNSPLLISNLGTRSMFQSLARPYFFQGSVPAWKLP